MQKKALRTTHFKGKFDHTRSLFSEFNITRLPDKIYIEHCLFVSKPLNNQLPEIFNNWLVFLLIHIDMKHHLLKKVCLK